MSPNDEARGWSGYIPESMISATFSSNPLKDERILTSNIPMAERTRNSTEQKVPNQPRSIIISFIAMLLLRCRFESGNECGLEKLQIRW